MRSKITIVTFFILQIILGHAQVTDSMPSLKPSNDTLFQVLEALKFENIQNLLPYMYPSPIANEEIVTHHALALSYNDKHEQPNWVLHLLTKDVLYGTVGRTNDFRIDPDVKSGTVDSVDYWDSGYDRGHMAPSADFRWSKTALSESFYYSNISPQVPELNRGSWSMLENQVREWSIDAKELYIVTGPVLEDGLPTLPQGTHRVSIPKLYYKIILDYCLPEYKATAFLFPNRDVYYDLSQFNVSIDSIEKITGIDFFPSLPDTLEARLEIQKGLKQWSLPSASKENIPPIDIDFDNGEVGSLQAKYYIGEECTICGTIVSTKYNINGKSNPTYITFDKKYPYTPFYVLILEKDRTNFSYSPEKELLNKQICVKGKVNTYNGTPNIIVNDESQISIKK